MASRQHDRSGLGRRSANGLVRETSEASALAGAALLDAYENFALKLIGRLVEIDPAERERVKGWATDMIDGSRREPGLWFRLTDPALMARLVSYLERVVTAARV